MIIALNHKSNLGKEDFLEYIEKMYQIKTTHELIICPSFINIGQISPNKMKIGSQNVSNYEKGAHTGEINPEQLKSYGVMYSIIGHSERRQEQKETIEDIRKKIDNLKQNQITPILCVGETKEERAEKKVKEVLKREIQTAIEDQGEGIIIAYEPIWSIGTGLIPSNKEIKKTIQYIKELSPKAKVLYGGSVNEENIDILKDIEIVDGYLLGGLSLKPEKLQILLNKIN